MSLAESDAAVKAYFSKLEPATKKTLLHDTTGPEAGADVGVVAAVIPDPNHPEFSVYWLRDACLVYHPWLNELTVLGDTSLRAQMDDVVHALTRSQQVISLAGNVFTGGIEEAVFDIKLNKLLDPKARIGSPAADGPPFRVSNLIKYAEWLIKPEQKNGTWVTDVLWPVINLDLQWISSHWNQSSWDLWWPPVWGGSTGLPLCSTVRSVAVLAWDVPSAVGITSKNVLERQGGIHVRDHLTDVAKGRSGYGSAPLTVSVYNFDPSLGCDDATFQPCSPRALSSLKVVGDRFKEFFPLSQNFTEQQPPYYGFFTEDQFIGGHPQFFASYNSAEQLYDALTLSLKFWKQFDSRVSVKQYKKGSKGYKELTDYARSWANKIVLQLVKATPQDHVLVECIDKETGGPYGPRGMIRSLAAALGVMDAYNGWPLPTGATPSRVRRARMGCLARRPRRQGCLRVTTIAPLRMSIISKATG
ncbi:Six-hairpin glycosidase-like protein [Russula brevipes]|nr:Six-hairpin glycosidase-like protein [Russula brevipes]